jgi:multidrug transporter EmrE-like cation transporter
MQSPRYSLNKEDLIKITMAMVYSGTAAALAYLAATLDQVDVPAAYMVFVPVANAMLYTVVKFLEGKSQV